MKRQKRPKEDRYKKLTARYSDDSSDETELFVRKTGHQEPATVEKVVEEGDTLQAIAIRYRCTVEELKRLNHILNDNEIFAKGVIKVPDRPFSTILAGIHSSGRSSPKDDITIKKDPPISNLIDLTSGSEENVNNVIFNSTITSKACDNDVDNEVFDEEVTLLPADTAIPNATTPSKFSCSGADADISWITLIILIVLLIVALPLIFIFYIAEHHVS